MKKTHTSLSPVTNILLTITWGGIAALLFFVIRPHVPFIIAVVGAGLGIAGGIMQHLSIKEAASRFLGTSSLMEVRRAFKTTTWGSRYIAWIYISKIVLALLSIILIRSPLYSVVIGYIAGYMSFMFVREIITIRDAFYLHGLNRKVM
ncbi:MAG: hypothetical protein WCD79_06305 [Chthoniobacteraceae bacterium]